MCSGSLRLKVQSTYCSTVMLKYNISQVLGQKRVSKLLFLTQFDLLKALRNAAAACKINAVARGPINNLYAYILSAFQ